MSLTCEAKCPIESIKQGLTEALHASDDDAEHAVRAIADSVSDAIRQPSPVGFSPGDRVSGCARQTLAALHEVGGRLDEVARAVMLGAVRGTRDEHVWAIDLVRAVAATLVRQAVLDGADAAAVTGGAIAGAIEAADEMCFSADEASNAAAHGALRAAASNGDFGVLRRVRAALPTTPGPLPVSSDASALPSVTNEERTLP